MTIQVGSRVQATKNIGDHRPLSLRFYIPKDEQGVVFSVDDEGRYFSIVFDNDARSLPTLVVEIDEIRLVPHSTDSLVAKFASVEDLKVAIAKMDGEIQRLIDLYNKSDDINERQRLQERWEGVQWSREVVANLSRKMV